ncbi:MAG: FG-GAP repeat domain-containing protein [Candidatus Pristimantibacillus sp.]
MFISRIKGAVLMTALLCMVTTGCRYTAAPADLLTKPVVATDKQALINAVNFALPIYSRLTLPLREDNLGAVRKVDLNGDGVEEAIVSYYNEYSAPEVMMFRLNSGTWKPWLLVQQPMARQIDWIKLEDFDQDGQIELAIGWIGSYESSNILEIYSFQTKPFRNDNDKLVLEPISSIPYIYSESGDINGDGKLEIAVIAADGTNQAIQTYNYQLGLYDLHKGELRNLQELDLYNGVNLYDRLIIGRVSPRHTGIIVEASTGAHAMYSAMYAWENGKLRLIYPIPKKGSEDDVEITTTSTLAEDSNKDGILELMIPKETYSYEELPYSEMLFTRVMLQWDGKKDFQVVNETYSDYTYRFDFTIPEQWKNQYSLRLPEENIENGAVTFEYRNEETGSRAEFATLFAIPIKEWEGIESDWKTQSKSYQTITKGGGLLYVISFVQEPPANMLPSDQEKFRLMKLTDHELEQLFHLIKD